MIVKCPVMVTTAELVNKDTEGRNTEKNIANKQRVLGTTNNTLLCNFEIPKSHGFVATASSLRSGSERLRRRSIQLGQLQLAGWMRKPQRGQQPQSFTFERMMAIFFPRSLQGGQVRISSCSTLKCEFPLDKGGLL